MDGLNNSLVIINALALPAIWNERASCGRRERRLNVGTVEFEWKVESLTDGQMISRMARENSARRKFDTSVIREAIAAAVEAHGAGKILPKEMPFHDGERQRTDKIHIAPGFSTPYTSIPVPGTLPPTAYTIQGLAKFLGFVKQNGNAQDSFIAAFGAEELIADGVMKESQIKGLSAERLGELVISVRKQRDAARVETARLAAEAIKRAGATVVEVKGSHAIYVSQPRAVADLIEQAATKVKAATA